MLALVDHITPRIRYIFEFLFNDVLGMQVSLTSNRDEFLESADSKICYSARLEEGQVNFIPAGILSDTGLFHEQPGIIEYEGLKVLFPVKEGGELHFDPFSMAFYILSSSRR